MRDALLGQEPLESLGPEMRWLPQTSVFTVTSAREERSGEFEVLGVK